MESCVWAHNVDVNSTKMLRLALRHRSYEQWCKMKYQGARVIHLQTHTKSNDFGCNKNTVSSSDWILTIKPNLNEEPQISVANATGRSKQYLTWPEAVLLITNKSPLDIITWNTKLLIFGVKGVFIALRKYMLSTAKEARVFHWHPRYRDNIKKSVHYRPNYKIWDQRHGTWHRININSPDLPVPYPYSNTKFLDVVVIFVAKVVSSPPSQWIAPGYILWGTRFCTAFSQWYQWQDHWERSWTMILRPDWRGRKIINLCLYNPILTKLDTWKKCGAWSSDFWKWNTQSRNQTVIPSKFIRV